jgi:NAD(P)-dependent dehydrogenase (short-subunit alcohol dehydrogenase family)
LINLTQVMANELAQEGIRVNCVCPGPIMTPLAMQVHTEQVQGTWKSAVPMHRYGTPREVAQAICFLLDTEKTAYMTGQVISVDGGFVNTGLLA